MGSTPLHLADRYRLYEQVGSGRFATVWLAWDETLARLVAVKVVRAARAEVPVFRARFLEQVRKAARLSHPAIVTIHDFGESRVSEGAPLPFVVMELLSGEKLAARIGRGPLPWREALEVCGQVASALAHAHAAGTAHYDLKPGNVLLTDGGPKVLDFGTGKLLGRPVGDAAAEDVRALGLLLSAAVTGRAGAEAELPSEVPVEVVAVHARCLLADPASRPSAAEVAAVLAESAEPRRPAVPGGAAPLVRRTHRAVRRTHRAVRRRRRAVFSRFLGKRYTAVLLSAVAVAAIIVLAFRGGASEPPLPPPPMAEAPVTVSATVTESADPSPSSSPSDSATPTPTASAEPPSSPRPTTNPEPAREATPAQPPPAPPADPAQVLSRAQRAVDDGVAAGEIRSDVGLDLNNVLGNLRRDLQQNPSVDLRARVAEIHAKIDTRLGENALTPSRAERLHAILNQIRA